MKNPRGLVSLASVALPLALTGCMCPHANRPWEYRVITERSRSELERQLNESGAQGYSIVSSATLPTNDAGSTINTVVILKRQKP